MSPAPSTAQRLAGPRFLVGGAWRRRALRARVVVSLLPVAVVVLASLWLALTVALWAALVPFLAAGGVLWTGVGRRWARRTWWRARWFWDARAAGLSLEAETSVFGRTDGPLDRHVLVVPWARVKVHPSGSRTYACRPLPGMTTADFEAATGRLMARWAAVSVQITHTPGDKLVTILVHRSAPASSTYRRRA